MKAKLVHTFGYLRFYELSEPIFNGNLEYKDVNKIFKCYYNQSGLLPKYKEPLKDILLSGKGTNIVVVSGPCNSAKKLVFPAFATPHWYRKYDFVAEDIEGHYSFYGIYPDENFLERLAKDNGIKWEGVVDNF